ncbi:MAG: hypothetical protein CFE37_08785 [Alphaproteobacteria bacterium PA4]|nr:MAG: hypothetical protein CFE37_08785 [Alphaproteobacteria bacterium PA4]
MPIVKRLALVGTAMLAGAAVASAVATGFVTVRPDQIDWRPVPDSHGVMSALIAGNPGKPGLYVIRVRFPPHVMDRPHTHSQDRHVTVLSGRWAAGTGPQFDPKSATAMPAGSYMFHPAGGVHWDGSNSDEAAVVQIIGMGPVTSTDLDPALAPWVEVER